MCFVIDFNPEAWGNASKSSQGQYPGSPKMNLPHTRVSDARMKFPRQRAVDYKCIRAISVSIYCVLSFNDLDHMWGLVEISIGRK